MSKEKQTILIIDDEINNVRILKNDLEDAGYEILSAADGLGGWEMLQKNKGIIKAILLDRMMPNMNGMEFMAKIKAVPDVAEIPVIMQTAAAEKEQVTEGVKAGAYYYLTKPYDLNTMLSVVNAAVTDYVNYSKLRSDLRKFTRKLHIVRNATFEIQTLDDAQYLATFLAQYFPNSEDVVLGIFELLINAIEHGNLGITYNEKTELNHNGKWEEEIRRRISLPEYIQKRAIISFVRDEDAITVSIKDEGMGFNWQEYMEISPDRATHSHGRGIALSKLMSFTTIEYVGCGNEVVCKVNLSSGQN